MQRDEVPHTEKIIVDSASLDRDQGSLPKFDRATKGEIEISSYLSERHIPDLLNFLVEHLAVDRPADPLEFLYDTLDKCLLFRAGLIEPPLLFGPQHIESVFKRLDPEGIGYISLNQYAVGMRTLGINKFNPDPMECRCTPNKVDKETFEEEAKRCLVKELSDMITIR